VQDYVVELATSVEKATPMLLGISAELSARRPAPGKWSAREIVGHLIDSASNNHQRFVRARWQDHLKFEGYAQDAWVAAQQYQDAPWPELVALWGSFNRHLARVMTAVPPSVLTRAHHDHNLHQLAWRPVPQHEPATLDYFMRDYVEHLKHHLNQVLGARWSD